ncbi:ABC transporter permease [Pollutimonas thiosulfatoxidans]|uniref:ABC transporter permease n=1 Tax=Pollutimonas thiosulfatoxidans TaxID=2028345 RepID=A0A410GCX4_9BURK|nr:ABC transporter permease [Pollutimonas thiosulfatoxidans]MBF6616808.1 ABC transporter permease [Candidimonas sp.]NYT43846.1 ABC transporter permease [Alcaligenaceae bacterium]QAA94119.1 ABC transporter permease [Pollutimonas thiosulfatoxidans]
MEALAPLLASAINAGTPLMLAALGLLVNEKSGVINLGSEGMMLVAAVVGFAISIHTGNVALGFAAGALAGMVLAGFFAWLTVWLGANQVATGLALSLFGVGASAYIGISYVGETLQAGKFGIPVLQDIPFIGEALFRHHPMVYVSLLLCGGIAWFLTRTRPGLVLRAVGESPASAHSLGYNVRRIRLAALLFGGACCGLAGAFMSLVYTPMWVEGMVAGRGWIALALTTFATWRPARVLIGAYLFGGITILSYHMQALGVPIASQLLSMLPYLATILVLVLISRNANWIRLNMPASLGKNFNPNL